MTLGGKDRHITIMQIIIVIQPVGEHKTFMEQQAQAVQLRLDAYEGIT